MKEYNAYLYNLKNEFRSYLDALNYVTITWLDSHKFVTYWIRINLLLTGQIYACIGKNVTSTKVKSAHARLNKQL